MEVVIIVVSSLLAAALLAAVVYKAVELQKRIDQSKQEVQQIEQSEQYLLDIVQDGKTVRIECVDVNSDNVELVSK